VKAATQYWCSWPLYFMLMVKVAISPAAPTVLMVPVAVFGGNNLTLGRRKLIRSLEQVTFSVPTVTPMIAAICSQVLPRATRTLIC
jgi:hypothetical protein